MKDHILDLIVTLGLALLVFVLIQTTILSTIVDGISMEPGLYNGQRLIVVKAVYYFQDPDRGDIVILHPPVEPEKRWVKRVIGLPGDTVEVKDGRVFINGIPLEEPYVSSWPAYTMKKITIPANNYFVLGDNRNHSIDSHYGWTVSRENIEGKVWLRIWPLDSWGIIPGYPLTEELENNSHLQSELASRFPSLP